MDRAQRLYLWLSGLVFAQAGYIEEGEASYYAASFEGLRTASGERYSRSAFTAAHRTLPFGTRVKVTHLRTGKTTIVHVNDRGPHRQGRIIDLSEAAARELGILAEGVARVRIEVIEGPPPPPTPTKTSPFFDPDGQALTRVSPFSLQIGAFSEIENAIALARNAKKELKKEPVFLWKVVIKGKPLYRVLVGHYRTRKEAEARRDTLRRDGWQVFVVSLPHE
jgi:rare lipoprotein A